MKSEEKMAALRALKAQIFTNILIFPIILSRPGLQPWNSFTPLIVLK